MKSTILKQSEKSCEYTMYTSLNIEDFQKQYNLFYYIYKDFKSI
jgi:hypothetical protein